jgi:predicted nucleic acid-binding protein
MKPRVFIETTIPSYLTAWPSTDVVRAAHQQLTKEWWAMRDEYELFTSQLVIDECGAGDAQAATARLLVLDSVSVLDQIPEITVLAKSLVTGVPLPQKATADSFHIATAAIHGLDYLLTWNCTHIANATMRPLIEKVCRAAGVEPPLICTPEELKNARR